MNDIIACFGTNKVILGIASICGILGFILTIIVTIRTANISKILTYNEITARYNKERNAYQRTFEGHRQSILEDNIKTDKLLKDILKNIEEYDSKYRALFSLQDKFNVWRLKRLLRLEADEVNFNSVCNYLSALSGRLVKKEGKKNV